MALFYSLTCILKTWWQILVSVWKNLHNTYMLIKGNFCLTSKETAVYQYIHVEIFSLEYWLIKKPFYLSKSILGLFSCILEKSKEFYLVSVTWNATVDQQLFFQLCLVVHVEGVWEGGGSPTLLVPTRRLHLCSDCFLQSD